MSTIDATTGEPVILPRSSQGTEPQHILLAVLGDYWFQQQEQLPSSALAKVLAEFGINENSARQAMRRLRARGLLIQTKRGRTTAYGFPPRTPAVIEDRLRKVVGFGADGEPWDQLWTIVTFSMSEENRDDRRTLRNRLRALRFGRLHDAVWVSPHDRVTLAEAALTDVEVTSGHVFRASLVFSAPPGPPLLEVFGIEDLRSQYLDFIRRYEPVATGRIAVENALVQRTRLLSEWLTFRTLDPELPVELLPAQWPRARAHEVFLRTYDLLGPAAEARFKELIATDAPDLAPLAQRHTSDVLH